MRASLLATAIVLLLAAAAWDVVRRRIPNAIPLALLAVAVALQAASGDLGRVANALGGGALTFVVLFAAWSRRIVGGGDAKLGTAAAVLVGWSGLGSYCAATAIAGGVVAAIAYAASARAARDAIRANLLVVASGLAPAPTLDRPGRVSVPYGVAITIGAVLSVLYIR